MRSLFIATVGTLMLVQHKVDVTFHLQEHTEQTIFKVIASAPDNSTNQRYISITAI